MGDFIITTVRVQLIFVGTNQAIVGALAFMVHLRFAKETLFHNFFQAIFPHMRKRQHPIYKWVFIPQLQTIDPIFQLDISDHRSFPGIVSPQKRWTRASWTSTQS